MYYSLLGALISLYSRGLFEVFFSKRFSYILEFSLFVLFLIIFLLGKIKLKFREKDFILPTLILFSSFISMNLSNFRGNDVLYNLYFIYFVYVVGLYIFFSSAKFLRISINRLSLTLSVVIYILFGVSCFEQLGIIHMPGSSFCFCFIRPSSLTGSYLHYPLVLACLGVTVQALKKKLTFPSLLAYIGVFTAFSRSGMFIVTTTFLITLLAIKFLIRKRFLVLRKRHVVGFLYVATILSFSYYFIRNFIGIDISYILKRFVSSVNINAPGNIGRLEAWKFAILKFSETNMLFGEYFGQVTNFTKNLLGRHSIIVESGLLQSLLNIGLIGTISFYLLFINLILRSRDLIFRAFLVAFTFESLVYQSIEVLPFITSMFLFYSFVKNLKGKYKIEKKLSSNGNYSNL